MYSLSLRIFAMGTGLWRGRIVLLLMALLTAMNLG
jgi:hypothetical protein